MPKFPNQLVEATLPLPAHKFSEEMNDEIYSLGLRGFEVRQGLTPRYAGEISLMAGQPHIAEFCPRDKEERFATIESTKKWIDHEGGRAMFLLLKDTDTYDQKLIGYGWTGPAPSAEVAGSETKFAIRIGEEGRGNHLATPFTKMILEGSRHTFGAKNFWLETWASNRYAVKSYIAAKFCVERMIDKERNGQPDKRVYMKHA